MSCISRRNPQTNGNGWCTNETQLLKLPPLVTLGSQERHAKQRIKREDGNEKTKSVSVIYEREYTKILDGNESVCKFTARENITEISCGDFYVSTFVIKFEFIQNYYKTNKFMRSNCLNDLIAFEVGDF
jgi:hypothetical protein